MSLHQQETLQEGDPVEKLGQRHLLLPGGAAEVREHCPQACGAADSDRWSLVRQVPGSPPCYSCVLPSVESLRVTLSSSPLFRISC